MAGYYVARTGAGGVTRVDGPYSTAQMRELARMGLLGLQDRVGHSANGPWARAGAVEGLFPTRVVAPQPPFGAAASPEPPLRPASPLPTMQPAISVESDFEPARMERPTRVASQPSSDRGAAPDVDFEATESTYPELFGARIVEHGVGALVQFAGQGFIFPIVGVLGRVGHAGILAAAFASAAFLVRFALQLEVPRLLLFLPLFPIAAVLGQYIVWKFTGLCERIVRNTPTRISDPLVIHLLGLLVLLSAAASIGLSTVALLQSDFGQWPTVGIGVGAAVGVAGLLFLNPAALNVESGHSLTAGADGLGVIGTLVKALLAGSRLTFGIVSGLGGTLAMIGFISSVLDESNPRGFVQMMSGVYLVAQAIALPPAFYLLGVLYYIVIDAVAGLMGRSE